MTELKPTMRRSSPRGMEMTRTTKDQREWIEKEALDIFATMTNGGCTFQQSLAAIFLSGMNAAKHAGDL
jgi:hypothetical protein